jgi:signal transduction histidine kinase
MIGLPVMNFGIRFKLTVLGFAVVLMGALIVLTTLSSERQISELRIRLSNIGSESSGIMDQYRDSLRKLNNALLRYGMDRDPADWETSLITSRELNGWINGQKTQLHAASETELLRQILTAYDNYLQAAWNFHDRIESLDGQGVSLADFTPVREQSQRLLDLGQALARAHYESHNELLQRANRLLEKLQFSVLILLGLLFGFGITMAVGVYRQLITPLRAKLIHTQDFAGLHEKLASLGLLASEVAHEVRNPLKSIKIGMSFQKNKFDPGTPERADADVVEREIVRLECMLDNFLVFTRPATPRLATITLGTFFQELRDFFTPQLAGINIQFVTEILAPMQVRADAAQLKQALISLVQNASNSIGCNGRITLRARPDRKLLADNETEVAVLEVADTGKGIRPEVEDHLFQPFFTTHKDGTCLGLSIAAQIVQKQGGELQYQTQVNRGTIFGIILPRVTT